jgi:hypothetical protein
MCRLLSAALLLILAAAPGLASEILFQRTFATDDQVALFDITANTAEFISIQSYSYAGGTVDSVVIPGGGFDPSEFLFDNMGDVQVLTNGTCSQVGTDSTTGSCNDLFFQDTLGPGTFTLALAVADNTPVDASVADGFVNDGNPGFTCLAAATSGNFCDLSTALGTSRTGYYAISISGADAINQLGTSGTPEPASMLLLLAGCGMIALLRRHSHIR